MQGISIGEGQACAPELPELKAPKPSSTADEAQVRAALQQADTSVLLMVYVHLTGDEALLEQGARYIHGAFEYNTAFPPEFAQDIRERVLRLMMEGKTTPSVQPSEALLHRMMSVAVGTAVPDEYLPMMLQQVALRDNKVGMDVTWRGVPPLERLKNFHVAIIGGGMSGIGMGIKLKQAGIPFTIFEKNTNVGGTWFENQYPGCRVDTPNHYYSFSFEPNHDWPDYYSRWDALHSYFERCADKYGLRPSIRLRTEVLAAKYDEAKGQWRVTVRGDGETRTVQADAIVFAVGQLNRPYIPDIPGLGDFAGPAVHTARWPQDLDLRGRRVAMIGTGASGMQVGPTVAPDVAQLTIYQRSPHWAAETPNYLRSVEEGKKWALKHVPYYSQWYRFQLFWGSSDSLHPMLQVDPRWPKPEQSLNAANEAFRQKLIEYIRREVDDDPELLAKTIPSYPPYGKRMLRDHQWYRMLRRSNVELVTDHIERITENAVVTRDGKVREADVIVLATGFRAREQLAPVDIRGRDGISIRDVWGEDDPRAYLGITVPKFPNMFVTYGPNTNIAHGGSAIFHAECQVGYIMQALRELIESGKKSMECRQDVHDAYNARVDEAHSKMVWAHKGVSNWYKNGRGRVTQTTPWRQVDYWKWTKTLNPSDYVWQ